MSDCMDAAAAAAPRVLEASVAEICLTSAKSIARGASISGLK